MVTIDDYIKNLEKLISLIPDEVENIVLKKKDVIINMNFTNIEEGVDSEGKVLRNTNKKYKGTYTKATEQLSKMPPRPLLPKSAGSLFNFVNTGDFAMGMDVIFNKNKVNIFSTGTGSGDKKDFFDGYKNLFGLTKEQQLELNYEIIKPELS